MQMSSPRKWFPRLVTFAVWAVLLASATFWALRLGQTRAGVAQAAAAPVQTSDASTLARVLGGGGAAVVAAPASTASRLVLTGVIARTQTRTGAALISVDGKPAKAYTVGAKIEDGLYLAAVGVRRASLAASAKGETILTLELPQPQGL